MPSVSPTDVKLPRPQLWELYHEKEGSGRSLGGAPERVMRSVAGAIKLGPFPFDGSVLNLMWEVLLLVVRAGKLLSIYFFVALFLYIYICVCVCVCLCFFACHATRSVLLVVFMYAKPQSTHAHQFLDACFLLLKPGLRIQELHFSGKQLAPATKELRKPSVACNLLGFAEHTL